MRGQMKHMGQKLTATMETPYITQRVPQTNQTTTPRIHTSSRRQLRSTVALAPNELTKRYLFRKMLNRTFINGMTAVTAAVMLRSTFLHLLASIVRVRSCHILTECIFARCSHR